jgi:hypothetical protein
MDKALRNTLRKVVTQCRKLLEDAIGEMLQGRYGIYTNGRVEVANSLTHLSAEEAAHRSDVIAHLKHIESSFHKASPATEPKGEQEQLKYAPSAVAQLIREAAFTHLNRVCAYKMMAQRGLISDPVGKGLKSRGFLFYLGQHPEDETLYNGAQADLAYRHYLEWLNANLSDEIGALFSQEDLASGLFPPHRTLEAVLELLNEEALKSVWAEDETIGWIFQYFTPKELREQVRRESAAPRNSYEMAFRNQFFTPRYVVEFLVDNALGRTWYEMRGGETALAEGCRYLAKEERDKEQGPKAERRRPKKDPRRIKVLDPACGSGHFLLYCFDLLQTIYEEAYTDPDLGPTLQQDFPDLNEFKRQVPGLILAHNIHGIDIDLRVTQLAALALWLRAQRAFQEMGLKEDRPRIERMNLVCAEPMPGEEDLLEEFIAELAPHPLGGLIGELVRNVFARMKLAGEAGALVRIEDDIREPIERARKQWEEVLRRRSGREAELARKGALFEYEKEEQQLKLTFDIADITDERVWHDAEFQVLAALREYARRTSNGKGLLRRLFSDDAEHGFAFIDICRKKFDVVLMNPPFGDASIPSKPYIDEVYGDTKGDVYKAFVECFQDRLVPGGFLGIISSRTGFFLSGSSDWRKRIVLRLYRPLVLADFGMGVLDAMVETAAYVLRSLTQEEDWQLTIELAKKLSAVPMDKNDIFSTKKYEVTRGLKRHQANGELRRIYRAGYIQPVEGHFPRWSVLHGEIAKAPATSNAPYPALVCLRLLGEEDKGSALYEALRDQSDPRRFAVAPEMFRQLPNSPFAYWISAGVRQVFGRYPEFESITRSVRLGLSTKNDGRFVRAAWEIIPADIGIGKRWRTYANGGAFSRFYHSYVTLVLSENDFSELSAYLLNKFPYLGGNAGWILHLENDYVRPCIGWPLRTHSFSPHLLPAETVFSARTYAAYEQTDQLAPTLSVMGSEIVDYLLKASLGRFNHPEFVTNVVRTLPFPLSTEGHDGLADLSTTSFRIKRDLDSTTEVSRIFCLPHVLRETGATLVKRIVAWQARSAGAEQQLASLQRQIDDIAFRIYGISDEDRRAIEASLAQDTVPIADEDRPELDEAEDEQIPTDHRELTADLISYAVGCAFGRWDVRFATGARAAPELPDPFAPLPVCAPGALTGEDGLPVTELPKGYPLRVGSDGILVDDPTHADDIVARVREVFELLWPEAAEAREREACEFIGVKDLRDYFHKPAAGGFWTDHVKHYSKSRRKAPIYWLLRSSKGNYALWLYYHRLDKDILYKALVNYVEPKLRLEGRDLTQLRQEHERVGTTGQEGKQIEKQLERQESLLSELHDFHDKLKSAADLHLEPDLNDGVVLNIAPLRELVPWKEAEKYWEELLEGKYEWSTISKQLRERGKVKR